MGALGAWWRSTRPLAHGNIAPALVFGQALAYATTGHFSMFGALVAHGVGVLDHLAIVWVNDLADEEGDRLHDAPTAFSGGSRVLVDGSLSRAELRRAATVVLSTLALVSAAALAIGAFTLGFAVAAALVLLWAYSGPPRRSHRGGGAWLQGLGIGVVLPVLGASAQGATVPAHWLLPSFLLAMGGHWVTAVPDERADARAGKQTLAVRHGGLVARRAALTAIGLGAALGTATLPGSFLARAVVLGVAALVALPAAVVHRDATPERRARCLVFVVSAAGAATVALLGWSMTAALAP